MRRIASRLMARSSGDLDDWHIREDRCLLLSREVRETTAAVPRRPEPSTSIPLFDRYLPDPTRHEVAAHEKGVHPEALATHECVPLPVSE